MLRGAHVVDPVNGTDAILDVGIVAGKVAEMGPALSGADAKEIVDLSGYTAIPGVVDPHTHVDGPAHRMMAKAGVCTALDMADMRTVVKDFAERGCGLNIAGLQVIGPWPDAVPSEAEVAKAIDAATADGAIGIKIIGGHLPSTPAATARMIEMANRAKVYVAFHCGTSENGSNLKGLLEAVELAGDNSLHIAHVNSYLRGMIADPMDEVRRGLAAIEGKKNLVSESYLAVINGTGGAIGPDGLPVSHVTRNCLRMAGYTADEKGLEAAIAAGYGLVQIEEGGEVVLITGARGVSVWREKGTNVGMSFPVNQPQSTFLCAVRKGAGGNFVVDAISTDGGGIPRNVAVEYGLALVKYRALTMNEFILKASTAGARMLGLKDKGHLGLGADADITVLDMAAGRAAMTIVGGKVVMAHGVVYGTGGTIITTPRGEATVKAAVKAANQAANGAGQAAAGAAGAGAGVAAGLRYQIVHPEEMLIYTKRQG